MTNPFFTIANAFEDILKQAQEGCVDYKALKRELRAVTMGLDLSDLDTSTVSAARVCVEECLGANKSRDDHKVHYAKTKIASVRIAGDRLQGRSRNMGTT